jgi:hypothetical protein
MRVGRAGRTGQDLRACTAANYRTPAITGAVMRRFRRRDTRRIVLFSPAANAGNKMPREASLPGRSRCGEVGVPDLRWNQIRSV